MGGWKIVSLCVARCLNSCDFLECRDLDARGVRRSSRTYTCGLRTPTYTPNSARLRRRAATANSRNLPVPCSIAPAWRGAVAWLPHAAYIHGFLPPAAPRPSVARPARARPLTRMVLHGLGAAASLAALLAVVGLEGVEQLGHLLGEMAARACGEVAARWRRGGAACEREEAGRCGRGAGRWGRGGGRGGRVWRRLLGRELELELVALRVVHDVLEALLGQRQEAEDRPVKDARGGGAGDADGGGRGGGGVGDGRGGGRWWWWCCRW